MGARPRLLLLHGFLSASGCWDPLRRHLEGFADVIAPDLPGYGGVVGPQTPAAYTVESLAELLVPLVERERPTHVLGHSMGGVLALALANRLPGTFERIGVAGLPVFANRAEALAHLNRQGLVRRAFLRSHHASHAACRAMYAARWGWGPLASWVVGSGYPPGYLGSVFRHTAAGHAGALEGIVFAGLVPTLASGVGHPVAALHGEKDRAAPLEPARAIADGMGWDFTVAPGAGHQVIIDRPRLTARWVRSRLLA